MKFNGWKNFLKLWFLTELKVLLKRFFEKNAAYDEILQKKKKKIEQSEFEFFSTWKNQSILVKKNWALLKIMFGSKWPSVSAERDKKNCKKS